MQGDAVDVTMADYGDEFKLMSYDVQGNKPEADTPHLPVAKQLWTPKQGLRDGAVGWLTVGGGHHTALSFAVDSEQLQDLSHLFDLTYVNIK